MSMIASSRERSRSVCPVSRRSFGRIVPSDATTASQLAIRRNPQNEIAGFWAVKARKLAISNPISPGKSTLDQPLGWFFTDDLLPVKFCMSRRELLLLLGGAFGLGPVLRGIFLRIRAARPDLVVIVE